MKNSKGFTFIEIMLVVMIIGILAALALPRLTGRRTEAGKAAAKADIEGNISMALDLYELDAGSFPSTAQGLKALIEKPTTPPEPILWKGPYLKKKQSPKDPWGNEYIYESPGRNNIDYDLSSAGPDGISGNSDDLNNWSTENSEE